MGQARGGTWTAERDAQLAALWAQGLSAARIARAMGLTKNAVIGRARRRGLPGRPSPILARIPAALREEARRRQANGEPWAAVARALGLPECPPPRPVGPVRGARAVEMARLAARGGGTPEALKVSGSERRDHAAPRPGRMSGAPLPVAPQVQAARASGAPATPSGRCDWPLWPDGAGPDHPAYGSFCGCPRVRGSYCAEHAGRAYVRVAA